MKRVRGFTLIELIIFIVIMSVIITPIVFNQQNSLLSASTTSNQMTANMLAQQCMEWLLGNRLLNGYSVLSCPSTPSGILCSSTGGFIISPNVTCTSLNSNANFKTISVIVSGNGNANLQSLIANY